MGNHFFFFLFFVISMVASAKRPRLCKRGARPSMIIVCSPRCGGCKLEDGTEVTCRRLDRSKFWVLVGVRTIRDKNVIIVSKITRVDCKSDSESESHQDKFSKPFKCKRARALKHKELFIKCFLGPDDRKPAKEENIISRMLNPSTEIKPVDTRTVNAQTRTTSNMTTGVSPNPVNKNNSNYSGLLFQGISSFRLTWRNMTKPNPMGSFPTRVEKSSPAKYAGESTADGMNENRSVEEPLNSNHTTKGLTWKRYKTGDMSMSDFSVRNHIPGNCFAGVIPSRWEVVQYQNVGVDDLEQELFFYSTRYAADISMFHPIRNNNISNEIDNSAPTCHTKSAIVIEQEVS